ncbi:ABC transporter permease [Nocardioides sp. NPDC023903]|uniref:ABC transporter permease n=1 Tax=Nocardioides sp. NPDC023903 TaxID=3157195 RepID=UPI00340AAAC7
MNTRRTLSRSIQPARLLLGFVAALVAGWMLLPTLVIIPLSFSSSHASFQFPPPGWSLDLYRNLASPVWFNATMNSLRIAAVVMCISTVVGTAAALALDRSKFRAKGGITALLFAPMIIPTAVVGIGVYATFLEWNLTGTYLGFIMAHCVVAMPMVLVAVTSSLRVYDRNQESAAASLGAGPVKTFFQVTLPQIRAGVATGAVLAFIESFGEVVISLFLASPRLQTLPVLMFISMRREVDTTVAAAATVILVAAVVVIPFIALLQTRNHHVQS